MSLDIETYAGYRMDSGKFMGYAVVMKDNGFSVAGSMASMEVAKWWNWPVEFSAFSYGQEMKSRHNIMLDMTVSDHRRWLELATTKMSEYSEQGAWECAELLRARYLRRDLTNVYECVDEYNMDGCFEKGVLYYGIYSGNMLLLEDMFGAKRYVEMDRFKRCDTGAYVENPLYLNKKEWFSE